MGGPLLLDELAVRGNDFSALDKAEIDKVFVAAVDVERCEPHDTAGSKGRVGDEAQSQAVDHLLHFTGSDHGLLQHTAFGVGQEEELLEGHSCEVAHPDGCGDDPREGLTARVFVLNGCVTADLETRVVCRVGV